MRAYKIYVNISHAWSLKYGLYIYMETDRSIGEGEAGAIYFGEALADESADEDDTPLNS